MKKSQEEKLEYLNKILEKLLLFSRHYTKVNLTLKDKLIEVKWCGGKPGWIHAFESIEFGIEDLDTRILHYKNKLKTNFNNRVKYGTNKTI